MLRLPLILALAFAPLTLTGCSTPGRLAAVPYASMPEASTGLGQVRYLVSREVASFEQDTAALLAREKAWLASQGVTELPPAYLLAISGGGDNGAFGAGLLNGWTASGTRPQFKVVTGVSTGALIAPFAFLGSSHDAALTRFYTTISAKNILKKRGVIKGLFSDAMVDSRPLADLIKANVDQPMLDAIAAEYAKGRALLVGTTNLDSLEPVIWNMTAIAASKDPRSLELFRRILLASASIPGAFPPVMIDVDVKGTRHQEMHVDGGTMAQVFAYPPSLSHAYFTQTPRRRVLYVIRNARFDSKWQDTPRKTMPIAIRAIGSLTTTQGIGDLYRIYSTTQRDQVEFNLAHIPSTFVQHGDEEFDTNYMRELYATGKRLAEAGYPWEKVPPGYYRPRAADVSSQ